jgi:hypothetical protein
MSGSANGYFYVAVKRTMAVVADPSRLRQELPLRRGAFRLSGYSGP